MIEVFGKKFDYILLQTNPYNSEEDCLKLRAIVKRSDKDTTSCFNIDIPKTNQYMKQAFIDNKVMTEQEFEEVL